MDATTDLHTPQDEDAGDAARPQALDDVMRGEEPTDEFLERWNALEHSEVSDEELERQALDDPGADGDPGTPE